MLETRSVLGDVRKNADQLADMFAEHLTDKTSGLALRPTAPPADGASPEVTEHHAREVVVGCASILLAAEMFSASSKQPVSLVLVPGSGCWRIGVATVSEGNQ